MSSIQGSIHRMFSTQKSFKPNIVPSLQNSLKESLLNLN